MLPRLGPGLAAALGAGAALCPLPAWAAGPLPSDLSPWAMFMAADIVVKAVMIGLAFASFVTWTVWIAKTTELTSALRQIRESIAILAAQPSLAHAAQALDIRHRVARALVAAALQEVRMSNQALDRSAIKERIGSRLSRLEALSSRSIARGTGLLATIGSTAPFVGLFGTVWGIMNAFIGISKAQTTNLAVVAPGIAEALLATAIGLLAAIPAVIIYNHFSRGIAGYRALVADASAEVARMASRDLDPGIALERPRVAGQTAE